MAKPKETSKTKPKTPTGAHIIAAKDGLLIGGHRYDKGDYLRPEHRTHDVLQAADGKGGLLTGLVKRTDAAPPRPATEPEHTTVTEPVSTPEASAGEPTAAGETNPAEGVGGV